MADWLITLEDDSLVWGGCDSFHMIRNRWLLIVAAFLCALPVFAQDQVQLRGMDAPLSIREAESAALHANPETKEAFSRQQLALAQLSEAKARLLPTVRLLENYAYSNNPIFVFGSLLMQHRFRQQDFDLNRLNKPHPVNNFFTAAFVHVPIFSQFQTTTAIAQGRLASTSATRGTELASQKIRFELVKAFFGVVVARANRDVAEDAVRLAEAEVKQAKDKREVGALVLSDELAMEVQLSEFEQQLIQSEGDAAIAAAELNKVLGLTGTQMRQLNGELLDKEFSPPSQSEAVQQALISRPDYVQSMLQVKERQQEIKAAYGRYLPKLDAYGAVIQDGNALVNGGTSMAVAVNMTFDIFDWKKPAKVKEAKAEREIANAQLQRKSNEITLDVIRAYKNFEVAQQKRIVAGRAVQQAKETLRIVRDRYRVGLTSITELLRAETAWVKAQTNLLAARYDYYVGYADILRVTGRLNDVAPFDT